NSRALYRETRRIGLKAGDKRSVFIDAASGFGEYNEQNRQHFKRSTFSADDVEVGTVMNFADAAGAELPGVIAELDDDWVTVDFNHPLAGRDLTFEVEIINVEHDAPEQAVRLN
ncbi:MAG: FKBP-type peptidyl-prolyl cis-trans isomerase, partial [Alloalcanivorax venustensis]